MPVSRHCCAGRTKQRHQQHQFHKKGSRRVRIIHFSTDRAVSFPGSLSRSLFRKTFHLLPPAFLSFTIADYILSSRKCLTGNVGPGPFFLSKSLVKSFLCCYT